jgi:hypothetical protein
MPPQPLPLQSLPLHHTPLPDDRPLRILLGTTEIAGQLIDLAAGFRALGHRTTTVVSERNALFPELDYDVYLGECTADQVSRLMRDHDVFVFQYGTTLLPGYVDLPVLRAAGKVVIALCNGDDVRHASAYAQEFGVSSDVLGEPYLSDPLARPLATLRLLERYATLMVSVPNQSGLALRPYQHYAYALDTGLYRAHVPDRDVPVIVHAPSKRLVKGTAHILAALDELRQRGLDFELRLFERMPNAAVREALTDADISLDQIWMGYGKYAAESLACGCATATVCYPDLEPVSHIRPVAHIGRDGLADQIAALILDRDRRRRLAHAGPSFVAAHHDRVRVCAALLDDARAAMAGTLRYDYYPEFAACRYQPPTAETIPAYLRGLGNEVIELFGLPSSASPESMVHRCVVGPSWSGTGHDVPEWRAADGRAVQRWAASPHTEPPVGRRPAPRMDPMLAWFRRTTSLGGAQEIGAAIDPMHADYLRLGLPQLLVMPALAQATASPVLRRAAGLLLLGTGSAEDAADLLATMPASADADGLVAYYRAVALAVAGREQESLALVTTAVARFRPRRRTHFQCGPAAAADDGTLRCRLQRFPDTSEAPPATLLLDDLSPAWTGPRLASALAPYHALLYVLLTGQSYLAAPGHGVLAGSAWESHETALLALGGVAVIARPGI